MDHNPYRGLAASQYWRSGVAEVGPGQFDPVTSVKFQITSRDAVSTLGSCFAQHLARHIKDSGLRYMVTEPLLETEEQTEQAAMMATQFSARYGNIYTTRQALQLLDRANGWETADDVWERNGRYFDAFRPHVREGGFATIEELRDARIAHLQAVKRVFTESDVVVFTLGLTEAWMSTMDGAVYPTAPGVIAGSQDNSRHVFQNFSYPEVLSDLLNWCQRVREMNSSVRILLTVSPVPLNATYMPRNVWTSTTYSKAVLRAVAGDVATELSYVDYFPSYEIVTSPQAHGRYFEDDLREVTSVGVKHVMRVFDRHYVLGDGTSDPKVPTQVRTASKISGGQKVSDVFCDEEFLD